MRSCSLIASDRRSTPISTLSRACLEIVVADLAPAGAHGEQRRLVDQVREIGAREPRRAARDLPQIDVRRRARPSARGSRRICSRPFRSGLPTVTWRSKRPGRSSAGSRMSGRLVAAMTTMPWLGAKPSISTSSWLSVCSRSSWLSELPPRLRPTASSSSMKMMHDWMAPRVLEQLADARGADAGVHLDEVGAAREQERHARLAGDRARQQRLAGAGRPDQQHAFRDAAADRREPLRLAQEVDDLPHFVLRLVHAGDVGEGHDRGVARRQAARCLPSTACGPRSPGRR